MLNPVGWLSAPAQENCGSSGGAAVISSAGLDPVISDINAAFHLGIIQIEKHGYGGGCIRKLVGVRGLGKAKEA